MAVEEAFPSFSTERIRSKVQQRSEGPVTQRRLNYNAPLLSVRRRANAGQRDASSKLWKLSAELSKEPLRVPGAVPFTWEQTPGQPKQPESPPCLPSSSPSPPSTPSPPSVRRASPASPPQPQPQPPPPPPPSLRPLFLRTSSETLFAPPPPPPPPPPPLPRVHRLPLLKQRTVCQQPPPYSGAPRPPPPPPPPLPDAGTRLNVRTVQPSSILGPRHCPDPERKGAFCLVDPTEEFLRLLRARREKLEPQESLSAETAIDEVEEKRHREVILGAEKEEDEEESTSERTSKHGLFKDAMAQVGSTDDKTNCEAVDTIVQRFLEEHPGAAAEEAASPVRHDEKAWKKENQAGMDAVSMSPDPLSLQENLDILQTVKNTVSDAINDPITTMAIPGSGLPISYSDEAAEAEHKDGPEHHLGTESVPSHTRETGGPVSVSGGSPSMAYTEVQQDAGHKQKTLLEEQQNRRRRSNVAILDTCRIESLQMLKSAILHLCRRAAAASLGTLNKAKRKIAAFRHTPSPRQAVVVHHNASRALNECRSDREEKAVASEVKMAVQGPLFPEEVQERSSRETQQPEGSVCILQSPPKISPRSSNGIVEESSEINPGNGTTTEENRVSTPVSSPTHESHHHERNGAQRKDTVSSLPHQKDAVSSSSHQVTDKQGSPALLQPSEVEEVLQPESRSSSARHVYAKSLGGDEPNEFYDASSRFGSRPSTPSRLHSNRSMSRDWPNLDEFSDATSTPFGSPRTSLSVIRYGELNAENSVVSPLKAFGVESCIRPASKLSKRVGKSLWVETREVKATGKGDAVNMDELKGQFASRELLITSNESGPASDIITEKNCASRKCVSAEQASSSMVDARRQHRQRTLNSGKRSSHASHAIAVTPVYPSKCQKNRLIASTSGLPRQISTGNMADVGWPLGISGYPPRKTRAEAKEAKRDRGTTKVENNVMVPLPPLPACPAGGSWLRKALSSSTHNHASLHAKEVEFSTSLGNKWEDIVKGSHIQPGHLRFSEELHHRPATGSTTTSKYYVS